MRVQRKTEWREHDGLVMVLGAGLGASLPTSPISYILRQAYKMIKTISYFFKKKNIKHVRK
jgi:hypothetical protein